MAGPSRNGKKLSVKGVIAVVIVAAAVWGLREAGLLPQSDTTTTTPPARETSGTSGRGAASGAGRTTAATGATEIVAAFEAKRSDVIVEAEGIVEKTLPDDRDGSRHQRFIVRLAGGHTVLIAHNIDLADRIPIDEGDRVRFKGEYEWTDRGGVIHWTHHDPAGRHPGGWIEANGTRVE